MFKKTSAHTKKSSAFSLIELMVVVSIISLLVGILVPGLKALKRASSNLKQKSQFHSMEVGLELFQKDYDYYPDSKQLGGANNSAPYICGAQHLVEALLGRDLQGFESSSKWYAPNQTAGMYSDEDTSLNRRRNPYIELKGVNVFRMDELYDNYSGNRVFSYDDSDADNIKQAPVFTDVFTKRRVMRDEGATRTGTPILYYKANQSARKFRDYSGTVDFSKWKFNFLDNYEIMKLGTIEEPTDPHDWITSSAMDGAKLFYEDITNDKVDTHFQPFNQNSFLLISAGNDGIFGTRDDVTNFDY